MKFSALVVTYALLALIATAVNLGSQMLSVWCYRGPFAIPVSILAGTGTGLVLKYVLDKRFIFKFQTRDLAHDGSLFLLYTAMGLITTTLFWGVEYAFHLYFGIDSMRYLGGALGLVIGYTAKYQLDKRYVFRKAAV
jgi:putative flippase GtrA